MRKILIITCFMLSTITFDCLAEGLDNLIEFGRSQAEIQRQYADETRAFEKVKKSIEGGAIKKGQAKSEIKEKYGEPVVNLKDSDGKHEKWVYRPENSTSFKGISAVLIFNKDGMLDELRIEER